MFARLTLASLALIPSVFSVPRGVRPAETGTAALAPAYAAAPARAARLAPTGERASARGIDVSHYQGRIEWRAVAADGVGFAFAKATEGATYVDPAFARNWQGMGEAGIARGAYHRFRPRVDATAQARHFLAIAPVGEGDLPVLDVESVEGVGDARLVRGVRAWLAEVERRTGKRPVVYTKPGFKRAHLGDALDDYPLWIAEYGVDSPSAGSWAFWQHSERGAVAGIGRAVDLDRYNGSADELRELASASPSSGAMLAAR